MTLKQSPWRKRLRILVVDDEEIVHMSLEKILYRAGYEITSVFSVREGLERLRSEQFDLAIVDLMMPEMNGIQFLAALASQGSTLPTLMVTGYPTIATAVQAIRLGAADYIAKPFTRNELLSPVRKAISNIERRAVSSPKLGNQAVVERGKNTPGATVVLPRHSWAMLEKDGTFLIGVDESILNFFVDLDSISIPKEMEFVKQGQAGFFVKSRSGGEHRVAMPLSGQVVAVNREALENPAEIKHDSWLVRVVPTHLDDELRRLVDRKSPQDR